MLTTNPIFCAIDRPDLEGALRLADTLTGVVGGIKLGLEFATANGPAGVRALVAEGVPVFLDLKFHDIPNTVAGAVRSAGRLGVAMMTIHAAGGRAMLKAAAAAAREIEPRPLLLGVTVLTSMNEADLAAIGVNGRMTDQVLRLAELAVASGLGGLVCSPLELAPLRQRFGPALRLVAPGIRPAGGVSDDQRRTLTPAEAVRRGADLLVVGRPITGARDPRAAAAAFARDIEAARAA
jgi:orotidine-5'-phosphate decarboxylase